MMQGRWDTSGGDEDALTPPGQPGPIVVSLHFVWSALRRRWVACALSGLLGLLMALGYLATFPQPHTAKATLVLTHPEGVDPTLAMATDMGLLMTQTVAAKSIAELKLNMRPNDLLGDVEAERVSPDVLAVTLAAPTDAEAVRRLRALTSIYLTFRAEHLTLQSKVLVDGMQKRINNLQAEVAGLSRRIELLSASDSPNAGKLSDTISQRAYAEAKIESLQQSVEDVTLRSASIVSSSMVVDPATVDTGSAKRRAALVLASGFIAGTGLGCGVVLFVAITSDRLRRRSDVANALGVAVPVSVGRVAPLRGGLRWFPPLWIVDHRRADERVRLAHTIVEELIPHGRGRLAIAGIDNTDEVGFAVSAAALDIAERGGSITVIDLTKGGSRGLQMLAPSRLDRSDAITLLRPRVLPALARDNVDLLEVGRWDEGDSTPSPQITDAVLILSDIEPAVGAYHLAAWTERVIVAVTAGRSSAEKIRTVGDLIRTAGLDLRFAALLHTEPTDDSLGEARIEETAPARPSVDQDHAGVATRLDAPTPAQNVQDEDAATPTARTEAL